MAGERDWGMVRTLAVNCATILAGSMNDGTNADKISSVEEVMGTVRALCEFCLLVSQRSHSDLSLTALDDALKPFYSLKGVFRKQKMSKTTETKVMNEVRRECVKIRKQKIDKIRVAVETEVYGAHKINAAKRKRFQARLDLTKIDD